MAETTELPFARRAQLYLTNLGLRALIGTALLLPYAPRVRLMGWLTSRVVAPLAGFDRRIRDNLALVCPDLPEAEIRRLVRAVPDNAGRTLIEIYSGRAFTRRAAAAPLGGPGLAALEAARAAGRPVILVTGHFGNYDVVRANLIARGHAMGALYRRMANPYFNAHYVRSMKAIGEPMFEQGRRGMMELVKHLRGGGVLGILTDLHAHGGRELTFFGKPAVTSVVTAELALKYGAELIPVYAIRQENGLDFRIEIQAPVPHSDPETMTQAVNDGLEALVRAHMDQWFWIHRRWKPWLDLGMAPPDADD
jgi:KDO2-lipid IV(A) lauroyltransferase